MAEEVLEQQEFVPDFALSLLEQAAGKEVTLEYEGLLPASPILTCSTSPSRSTSRYWSNIVTTSKKPFPIQAPLVEEARSAQVLFTAYYIYEFF